MKNMHQNSGKYFLLALGLLISLQKITHANSNQQFEKELSETTHNDTGKMTFI